MYLPYEGWNDFGWDFETKAEAIAHIQKEVDMGNEPGEYMLVAPLSWSVNLGGKNGK